MTCSLVILSTLYCEPLGWIPDGVLDELSPPHFLASHPNSHWILELENRVWEEVSHARHLLGECPWDRHLWKGRVEKKAGLGRGEVELQCDPEKISPFPKGCFGVGRPFRAVQIESIWQAFIPELNRPWMPLEVGVNRQGSFLQQRKTPKEANTCRLLDRGAPSFLGEWVLPFCREIFSASEHLSSHAWLLPADLWAFCLLFLLSGNFLFAIYLISLLHGKSLTRLNSLLYANPKHLFLHLCSVHCTSLFPKKVPHVRHGGGISYYIPKRYYVLPNRHSTNRCWLTKMGRSINFF